MLKLLHKNPTKSLYYIILFLAVFSTIYNAFIPLHGDEAYYWMWSHHLQFGYFDHPPMIAYMIYLTNFISQSEWGVRLVNIISISVTALYIFKLAKEVFNEHIALNAVIIFSSVILTHAGLIITTTDSPLNMFWAIGLYYSYKAIFFGKRSDYVVSGIVLGLMMLSKYTAILFVFTLLIYLLIKRRDLFFNINFYIAVLLASIIVSPLIWWNYQHDWISFTFQLDHGSTDDFKIHLDYFLPFLGGQLGLFSPVFTAVLYYYLIKDKLYYKDDKLLYLSLSIVVMLLFFYYKNLFKPMGLNYIAPVYIGGAIMTAYIFDKYELKKLFKIGLIIALFFTVVGRILFMFYLDTVQERMYGNKEAVHLLQKYAKPGDHFYGDHLTTAAYLKFYLKGHPDTDVATGSRMSQYDLWRKKDFLKDGLILTRVPMDGTIKGLYKDVKVVDTLTVSKGFGKTKTFYIYRVKDAIKR